MQRLIEEAQRDLSAFVAQRQDLLALVGCNDSDQNIYLQIVKDYDRNSGSDLAMVFLDNFVARGPYVDVLLERFRMQLISANQMASQEGAKPLADPPQSLFDARIDAGERLRDALKFSASLLPKGDHRLVWVLFPQHIADRAAWLHFLTELLPRDMVVQKWMRQVRLLCRDQRPGQPPNWSDFRRVHHFQADFSAAAIDASFSADLEDESLPDERRFQALYSLAVMDGAHNRKALALSRFETLRGYYQQTGNLQMEALVIQGMGDCYRRNGELVMANDHYECAVEKAVDGKAWLVFYASLRGLAEVNYELGSYALAEIYYERAEQLATHLLDPEAKVQMIEGQGLSQEKQGKLDQAADRFEAAVCFSRNVDLTPLLLVNLKHLERVCVRLDDPGRLAKARQERLSVSANEAPV